MSDPVRFIRALAAEPLAIERRTFDAFHAIVRKRGLEGVGFNGSELHSGLAIDAPRPERRGAAKGRNVQVIPIVGTVSNRMHSMGMGAMETGQRIARAANDHRVDAIVLDVDSPGGTVGGVPELAQRIYEARQKKPIVAVANGLMASAAYWIGAAASEVVASPSSEVGSIGVFLVHEDWSKWLESEGVVVTEISAGRYKTEAAPWRPLDEAAADFLHGRVATVYNWFTSDVARFRGDSAQSVRRGYGEGRVLGSKAAKAAGLVDRVATLDDVVEELASGAVPGRRAAAPETRARVLDFEVAAIRRRRLL